VKVKPRASFPRSARTFPLLVQIETVFFCELFEERGNGCLKNFTDYLTETMGWRFSHC